MKLVVKSACGKAYLAGAIFDGFVMGIAGTVPVISVSLIYRLIEEESSFRSVIYWAAAMLAFVLLSRWWMHWYSNVYKPEKSAELRYHLNKALYEKSLTLDVASYYDPEFYNDFSISVNECHSRAIQVVSICSNAIQHTISLVSTSTVLAMIDPILSVVAIVTSVLHIVLQKKLSAMNVERRNKLTPLYRQDYYYNNVFSTSDYAREIRVSDVDELLLEKYNSNQKKILDDSTKENVRALKYSIPFNLLSGLVGTFVYTVIFYQILVKNSAEITDIAVATTAFWSLRFRIQGIVRVVSDVQAQGMFIGRLIRFMGSASSLQSGSLVPDTMEKIKFDSVSFGYDKTRNVLDDINLSISNGEKIAIVGRNGSGKSTFVRLLLHLYDPDKGRIEYNRHDIREYSVNGYRNQFAVVNQNFCMYALPISENILCGIMNGEREVLDTSIRLSELDDKIKGLPKGYYTELTREFYDDGTVLSGGEQQKLAIAHVFAANRDIIVMDEPSAALDPLSEAKIMENLDEYTIDKTVIIVSHRLSCVRNADKVFVFDGGKIVESGTHAHLMQMDGMYAKMYNIQASRFEW